MPGFVEVYNCQLLKKTSYLEVREEMTEDAWVYLSGLKG